MAAEEEEEVLVEAVPVVDGLAAQSEGDATATVRTVRVKAAFLSTY